MKRRRKDLRQFLVRHGLSFYRAHMKGNWIGRAVGGQILRRGFVTSRDLQASATSWSAANVVDQASALSEDLRSFAVNSAVPGFHISPPLNWATADGLSIKPAINVLLPSLKREHMSGGPNTALIVAALLAERGERVRLIATDVPLEGKGAELLAHIDGLLRRPARRDLIEVVDGVDRQRAVVIGSHDIFLATAWWTAQIAKFAVPKTLHRSFIYLIQDFEPILHEGSTFHARSLETYGFDHIPVVNTRLLLDHLLREGAGRYADPEFGKQALWFEPALDRKSYFPEQAPEVPNRGRARRPKKTLLFYARPLTARRNLYEMGVVALREAVAAGHIDKDSWDVWAMGEKLSPVDLGNGVFLNPLPWMTFEDYARRVRTADLLLSLMLSPHPSYPPLEMAASGKLVVTNSYSVKSAERLNAMSPNILIAEPSADGVAKMLGIAVGRINAGLPSYDPFGHIALPSDWNESLGAVVDEVVVRVQGLRAEHIDIAQAPVDGFPAQPETAYEHYRHHALRRRRGQGVYRQQPGLLSFVTTVYDTDSEYLERLAGSLFLQDGGTQFEWLILDNGSTKEATTSKLAEIARHSCVRLMRVDTNLGIIGGMRMCLEHARNRYVMPLDSDDLVDRDCVNVVTRYLVENGYPPALYTDEDKLDGRKFLAPYFKPDWDPVLFLHSCYIAHLCAIDREIALSIGCYSDKAAEGCHDWDSFIRLMNAGVTPLHVPEVLYSWRMHAQSTSANIGSKAYITRSHVATLQRALDQLAAPNLRLVPSPLFGDAVDWWYRRERDVEVSCVSLTFAADLSIAAGNAISGVIVDGEGGLLAFADRIMATPAELIHICWSHVTPDGDEWLWDAAGLLEMFTDAVMVGGMLHQSGRVVDGPRVFGFGGGCDCPDRGRSTEDPGYFAQIWKARSVSAVSSGHCVIRRDFLMQILPDLIAAEVPLRLIGPWIGGLAAERGVRIVFSPFMTAVAASAPEDGASSSAQAALLSRFWAHMPERRWYSPRLGLTAKQAYLPVSERERSEHLAALQNSTLPYEQWLRGELLSRRLRYPVPTNAAAITIVTPIYAGSDIGLLDELAQSILRQSVKVAEWILLVNGPMPTDVLEIIRERATHRWHARLIVEPDPIGIVAALRMGLEAATGSYVVPVDGDDLVTDDAIQILSHYIDRKGQPDFLFSDEDLLIGGKPAMPYLRGDYDALLSFDNSTIWHLCAMKRDTALSIGIYSDPAANWCQDWDSVSRMVAAGGRIEHVPEVLYHWRQHEGSTTNNAEGDVRSLDSVRYILERHIARLPNPDDFEVADWPETRGARELYIARKPNNLPDFIWYADASSGCRTASGSSAILVVAGNGVSISDKSVFVEVARLFDLHPRVGGLGGNVIDADGRIVDGCYLRNAKGELETPWNGRAVNDGGPFVLALKTQRVTLPGSALAFFRISALEEAGLWPLATDVEIADIAWRLSGALAEAGWSAGFSPLIRGYTTKGLRRERTAHCSHVRTDAPIGGFVRYGQSRNFLL